MRRCLRRNAPGPYQIQAAINAVHSDAADAAATDWGQVVALYDQLARTRPVAGRAPPPRGGGGRGRRSGRGAGARRRPDRDLDDHHLFHAVRADLLRRLGRTAEARAAYDAAISRAANRRDQALLRAKRADVTA